MARSTPKRWRRLRFVVSAIGVDIVSAFRKVSTKPDQAQTRSVFERYNIVSDGDLREGARRLEEFTTDENLTRTKEGRR